LLRAEIDPAVANPSWVAAYELRTIPDPSRYKLKTLSHGNPRAAIARAHEQVLRLLASFGSTDVVLGLRLHFDPSSRPLQKRLRVFLRVGLSGNLPVELVADLVERGPLSPYFELERLSGAAGFPPDWDLGSYTSGWEIVREEMLFPSLVDGAANPNAVPFGYYLPGRFSASRDNDGLLLDRLLSGVESPVAVDLMLTPWAGRDLRSSQIALAAAYQKVNCLRDSDGGGYLVDRPRGVWNVQGARKDPLADEAVRFHQRFRELLWKPLLRFHFRVFGELGEVARLVAGTLAESGFREGKYSLLSMQSGSDMEVAKDSIKSCRFTVVPHDPAVWAEGLSAARENPKSVWKHLGCLSRVGTVEELAGVFRLPMGGFGSAACIRMDTDPDMEPRPHSLMIGADLESGCEESSQVWEPTSNLRQMFEEREVAVPHLYLPLSDLAKHAFVAGASGSGKTTALYHLLVQMACEGIPFLVIEPVKTEYRILKMLAEHPDPKVRDFSDQLRVYTPGKESLSPLRLNPFIIPKGTEPDLHRANLLTSFEAAMPMGGPLQALLAEGIERVYDLCDPPEFPQMRDLFLASKQILQEKTYSGEVRDHLSAMIEVRLGMLTKGAIGKVFSAKEHWPGLRELLSLPTILELDALAPNHASLLTLFILTAIREDVKAARVSEHGVVHHVTVLEEAHNLVGRTKEARASEENADPKAFAAEFVTRMLAEMRALGEGMLIADQLPSAVAPEVVKNTSTKLAHRLVSVDDREDLGGAMLLDAAQTEEIARLQPGEAYFYTEGLYRPRRVRVPFSLGYLGLKGGFPRDADLRRVLEEEVWFVLGALARGREKAKTLLARIWEYLGSARQVGEDLTKAKRRFARLPRMEIEQQKKEATLYEEDVRIIESKLKDLNPDRLYRKSVESVLEDPDVRLARRCQDPDFQELANGVKAWWTKFVERWKHLNSKEFPEVQRLVSVLRKEGLLVQGRKGRDHGNR
jgi:hypothetical protein